MSNYNFDELVGNIHVLNVIKRELENHTLNNFLIFEGSPGTGKSTCAEIIGLQKACSFPKGPNPCLECEACKINMEVLEKGNRGKNLVKYNMASPSVKSNLTKIIDEVFKNVPPFGDSVYIFEEFHNLNKMEQSALLEEFRTLDQNVFIIATTTRINDIIPEMRSRANIYTFNKLTKKEAKYLLNQLCVKNNIKINTKVEKLIIDYAKGIPRNLIKIFEHSMSAAMSIEELETFCGHIPSMTITQLFRTMKEDNLADIFQEFQKVLETFNLTTFAEQLLDYILNVTFYLTSNQSDLFEDKEKSLIRNIFEVDDLFKMCKIVETINPKTCTESQMKMTLIKLYQVFKKAPAQASNLKKASKQTVEATQRNREIKTLEVNKRVSTLNNDQIKKLLSR